MLPLPEVISRSEKKLHQDHSKNKLKILLPLPEATTHSDSMPCWLFAQGIALVTVELISYAKLFQM